MSDELMDLGFAEDYDVAKPEGIRRNTGRYIFFAGNQMSDKERYSAEHLHLGGCNYGSDFPALSLTAFVLSRCRITPIAVRPRPMPKEELIMNPHEVEKMANLRIHGERNPRIQHVKTYPNDSINQLVYHEGNINGKVELTAIEGLEYFNEDGEVILANAKEITRIQNHFFPNWAKIIDRTNKEFKLPETLRGIEEMINRGVDNANGESLIVRIGDEMLQSCEKFRIWANNYLDTEDNRVNQGLFASGFSHEYSGVAKSLQRQLEREGINRNASIKPLQQLSENIAILANNQTALSQIAMNQANAQTATAPKKAKVEVKETAELAA